MSVIKPSIPKGTRDFGPAEVAKRQYIFSTIKTVFEKYGYQPIETPVMENLSTLEGKYGEEGDKLLFRVLESGDYIKEVIEGIQSRITVENEIIQQQILRIKENIEKLFDIHQQDPHNNIVRDNLYRLINEAHTLEALRNEINDRLKVASLTPEISGKGLRYDLTVPFARFVVMHQNDITFPFKRYQIQPVWRADRPQKGRYREFYQCDADVVGSDSLVYEMELVKIYDEVFTQLNIPVAIKLNNRKVLSGMAESIGAQDQFMAITIAIDKLDKIGLQGVRQELNTRGISESQMQVIEKFFSIKGSPAEMISKAKELLSVSPTGLKGLEELQQVLDYLKLSGSLKQSLEIDFTLARGLNYYTGAIIEVKPTTVQMGSVGGGGRYDDLTGMFGLKGISGVGVSFGADRIYDVLEELKLFPENAVIGTKLLFVTFDDKALQYSLPLLQQVRSAGIAAEIYPSPDKMKKQMKYADEKKIQFVAVIGDDEMKSGKLSFKNMSSGEQELLSLEEIISKLK